MPTVLIADDEPANRLLLRTLLEHAGHVVIEANDGAQAFSLASQTRPDLAIVDLHMAGESGVRFIERLRSNESLEHLPVMIHTASDVNAAMRDFMTRFRVRGVIPKPCEPAHVLAIVNDALRA